MVSEDSLIEKAVQGDQEALAALLERHGPSLREGLEHNIPRKWRSVLSADDIMQQTYADALRCIGRFRPAGPDSFVSWLTTLRNNNRRDAIKGLERQKRGGNARRIEAAERDHSTFALLETLAVTSSTPSRRAGLREGATRLKRAISQLPEAYACAVRMLDIEERPLAEVAGALGRTPGAVSMLRARAHDRLREIMGPASAYFSTSP